MSRRTSSPWSWVSQTVPKVAKITRIGDVVTFKTPAGDELEGTVSSINEKDEHMDVQVEGYIGEHRVRFESLLTVTPAKPSAEVTCVHHWVQHVGIAPWDMYYYCKHCDKKKEY